MIHKFVKEICDIDELDKIQDELLYLKDYIPLFLFLTPEIYTNERFNFMKEHCDEIVSIESNKNKSHLNKSDDEIKIKYFIHQLIRFLLQHPEYKNILNKEGIKKYSIPIIPRTVFKELPYNDILNEISYLGLVYEKQEELINFKEYVPVFLFLTNESYEKRMKFLKENKLEDILKRTKKSTHTYLKPDSLFSYYKEIDFIFEFDDFINKNPQFQFISTEMTHEYIEEHEPTLGFADDFGSGKWFILYYGRLLNPLCNFYHLLKIQESLIELDSYVPIFLYITRESLKLRMDYLQKIKQEDLMEQYRESLNYFYPTPDLNESLPFFAIEMKYFLEEFPEFKKIINYKSVEEYMKEEHLIGPNKSYIIDEWGCRFHPIRLKDVYPIENFYIKK